MTNPKPSSVSIRNALLQKGFFPEVLPPCFDSHDLKKGFSGIITSLDKKKFHKDRSSHHIRYNGTKHDGNRRPYGTVNPVPYFSVANFIASNWQEFAEKINSSQLCLSSLRLGADDEDRAIVVPPLSELTGNMSKKIRYSPFIVKTDIAQFFPSIYTHSISWAAHGIAKSKADQNKTSTVNTFNRLDWFTQQCQNAQTRGVVIGPDAFRIIAEFISCEMDQLLFEKVGKRIIGAVRHVDDFYIGVSTEVQGTVILSQLREILQGYELQLNDGKTKILSSLEPVDDIWAQELRSISLYGVDPIRMNFLLDKAVEISKQVNSQSPMKLVLRLIDKQKAYKFSAWSEIEAKLQRVLYHFPHCVDYVSLLLVKRFAIGEPIDQEGWEKVCALLIRKNLTTNHHHELCWLVWLSYICKLKISDTYVSMLSNMSNSHVKALVIAGYQAGYIAKKPEIRLGSRLNSSEDGWLHNLVGRTSGYSKAKFSGNFADEFEHFAEKNVRLINFKKHLQVVSKSEATAISRSKYGYDAENEDAEIDFDDWYE